MRLPSSSQAPLDDEIVLASRHQLVRHRESALQHLEAIDILRVPKQYVVAYACDGGPHSKGPILAGTVDSTVVVVKVGTEIGDASFVPPEEVFAHCRWGGEKREMGRGGIRERRHMGGRERERERERELREMEKDERDD
jgi:hypothetical protein